MHVSSRRSVVVLAVLAVFLMRPARTTTMQGTDWNEGDVFVGLGDASAYDDPVDPALDALLGTYSVFSENGTDKEDPISVPSHGITTGCAVDPLNGDLLTTSFDSNTVDRISGVHDSALGHVWDQSRSPDLTTMDPRSVNVKSVVFDRSGSYYVGVPNEESDFRPELDEFGDPTGDLEYRAEFDDDLGMLLKFNSDGTLDRQYRLPVDVYPTGYTRPDDLDLRPRGVHWIDLSADGTTLFYTSEDRFIRTFTFDTDASQPGEQPGPGPGNPITIGATTYPATPGVWGYIDEGAGLLYALRLLPPGDGSGGLLVAGPSGIYRTNPTGAQVMRIRAFDPEGQWYFAVNLSPDAKYVWTATQLGEPALFKFHVATGEPMALGTSDRLLMPAPVNGLCVKAEYTSQSVDCTATPASPLCRRIELCSATSPLDDDEDGWADDLDPDCDVPGAVEICTNGEDDDRNGLVDETCPRTNTENDDVSLSQKSAPTGEERAYAAANLPAGVTINPETGLINGTLSYASAGVYQVNVTVDRTTSAGLRTGAGTFTWTVLDKNAPPVLDIPDQFNDERAPVSFVVPLPTDPDGDPVTSGWPGPAPAGLSYDAATHTLSGTLEEVTEDTISILYFDIADDHGNGKTVTFRWTVRNVNRAPVITPVDPQVSDEGTSPSLQIDAVDLDAGDTISFAISAPGLPIAIDATTGLISVTAPGGFPFTLGTITYPVTVTVTESHGLSSTVSFDWTIRNVNRPPSIAVPLIPDRLVGTPLTFTVTASDPDGDTLTFSMGAGWPAGFVLNATTGTVTGTSITGGTFNFPITVSDGHGGTASAVASAKFITNRPPVCSAATPSVSLLWPPNGKMVRITVKKVTDPDGDAVTIRITGIFQDEPTNTEGDGSTAIDGAGIGTSTAWVRAERTGTRRVPGNGRVYHIYFTATDAKGATCTGEVKVGVPHDQGGGHQPIDGGPLYNSTIATPPVNDGDDHDGPHHDGDLCDHDKGKKGHRDGDGCKHDRDSRPRHYDGDGDDHDKGKKGHRDGDGCEHDRDTRLRGDGNTRRGRDDR